MEDNSARYYDISMALTSMIEEYLNNYRQDIDLFELVGDSNPMTVRLTVEDPEEGRELSVLFKLYRLHQISELIISNEA